MSTMTVKDSSGADVTIEKPLAPGRAAAIVSRPVALCNEDAAFLDGLETKLDTIATNLASATLPVGAGTATAAGRTTLAADDPAVVVLGAQADVASATTSIKGALRAIATALGITALDLGSGTSGSRTLRWFQDTAQWIGGAGPVSSAVQRTTLASDDPAVAALGVVAGTKVITDANGTLQQYLRGIVSQWIAGTLTLASRAYGARVSVTRPSNTTAYAANDVVGVTGGGTATITFPNMGSGAGEVMIVSASLERDASALISGEAGYILHLFNVTQPAAQTDNDAFDLVAGDRAAYLGSLTFPTPTDLGSTLYTELTGINKQVTLAGTSLFGVLVTIGAYTPASAAVHIVTLHTVA